MTTTERSGDEGLGDDQVTQLEGVEILAAVRDRAGGREVERLAGGNHLRPGSGETGDRPARARDGLAHQRPEVHRRLHEHYPIPAVRRHGDDVAGLERSDVSRLERLAPVDESSRARVRP